MLCICCQIIIKCQFLGVLPNYLVSIEKQPNMIQALYGGKCDAQANVILKPDLCMQNGKIDPKVGKTYPRLENMELFMFRIE